MCLRAYVLACLLCFAYLRAYVLMCLACLRAYVLPYLACLPAWLAYMLGVLTCFRASVLGVLACVRGCYDEIVLFSYVFAYLMCLSFLFALHFNI